MNKKTIIIRSDSDRFSGFGHLIRCMALAQILSNEYKIIFVCEEILNPALKSEIAGHVDKLIILPTTNNTDSIDNWIPKSIYQNEPALVAIIVDGYKINMTNVDCEEMKHVKYIKIIDIDEHDPFYDGYLSHSLWDKPANKKKSFFGLEFAMLRQQFYNNSTDCHFPVKTMTICCGGLDVNNYTMKLYHYLSSKFTFLTFNLICGTSFDACKSLPKNVRVYSNLSTDQVVSVFRSSQIAVTSASGVAIELAALGQGLIIGYYLETQKELYTQLVKRGIGLGIGNFNTLDSEDLLQAIMQLIDSKLALGDMIKRQKCIISNKTPNIIKNAINRIISD